MASSQVEGLRMSTPDYHTLQVAPLFARLDIVDCGISDAITLHQDGAGQGAVSDRSSFVASQFRAKPSVPFGVGGILGHCSPSNVTSAVIEPVSVSVCCDVALGRLRPTEGFSNQAMNGACYGLAIAGQRDRQIACRRQARHRRFKNRAWPSPAPRRDTPNAPNAGNLIFRRVTNDTPFFVGIIGVSHSVSPHVRGQGRAARQRCFRPVFLCQKSGESAMPELGFMA